MTPPWKPQQPPTISPEEAEFHSVVHRRRVEHMLAYKHYEWWVIVFRIPPLFLSGLVTILVVIMEGYPYSKVLQPDVAPS